MLNVQIKIIISSEKWFNNVVTFFLWGGGGGMPKNWVGRTTLNGEKKKRMAITRIKSSSNFFIFFVCFCVCVCVCVCVLFSVVFTHLVLSLLAVVPAMF